MPEVIRSSGRRDRQHSEETQGYGVSLETIGSRVVRERPSDAKEKQKQRQTASRIAQPSIIDQAYDTVLAFVNELLPDVSHDIVQSAAETAVETMKDSTLTDASKKSSIDELLGGLSNIQYNQLFNIVQRIPDQTVSAQDSAVGVAVSYDANWDDAAPEDEETSSSEDEESEVGSDGEPEDVVVRKPVQNPRGDVPDVDARWLAKLIAPTNVPLENVLQVLEQDDNDVEDALLELFDYENLEIVKILTVHRARALWLTRYNRAETGPDRDAIKRAMTEAGFGSLLASDQDHVDEMEVSDTRIPQVLDLDPILYGGESKAYADNKFNLPEGSVRSVSGSYEQYRIPHPSVKRKARPTVSISQLPEWSRVAFPGVQTFNPVQSQVFDVVFNTDNNVLLSAPTGAGKTNVALLAIMRLISKYKREAGSIDLDKFKIIYVSPLKALVQEQVRSFTDRLAPLGITVEELSGDRSLSAEQIAVTNILVTTPEKWDVVSRKASSASHTSLVQLMIVDEIHLLNDERGPVIENIVVRAKAQAERGHEIRLIGLSATLSNYESVAEFLNAGSGTFHFDNSFRPVPLNQTYIGVLEKNGIKKLKAMNDAVYEKVMDQINDFQVIVFVHSRRDTVRTAEHILDRAQEEGKSASLPAPVTGSYTPSPTKSLQNLLERGAAVHHAGLSRNDRSLVEQLFFNRAIKVLVSTATLAWGVNLPAHTVIIKGTQVYSPSTGSWEEVSPQDVLQMLGRAGRPGFDTVGEGMIITEHQNLGYYMSIMSAKFPIESHLIAKLLDSLNAEVNLGRIRSLAQGVEWLKQTYLYVRMRENPVRYRVGVDYDDEHRLQYHCEDLVHSAFHILHGYSLVIYDDDLFEVFPQALGGIGAEFYVSPSSMATYSRQMKPYLNNMDVFRVFSRSEEFRLLPVRREEKLELTRLRDLVPVPIKEQPDTSIAKANILLQAYIGRLRLSGFALGADMVYISQSASRLIRAMFEIALINNWASLAAILLELYKAVDKRIWPSLSPLRQFDNVPADIVRRVENSQLPFKRYFDLQNAEELGEALRNASFGPPLFDALSKFPRFALDASYQTLTPSLIRILVDVEPLFTWDSRVHGRSQGFLLLIQSSDGSGLLYDWLRFTAADIAKPRSLDYTLTVAQPVPPVLIFTLRSERWLHSFSEFAMSTSKLILPAQFSGLKKFKAVPPMDVSEYDNPFEMSHSVLDSLQSLLFPELHESQHSLFVGVSNANERTSCAEISIHANYDSRGTTVCLVSSQSEATLVYQKWSKNIPSIRMLEDAKYEVKSGLDSRVVVCTPAVWLGICSLWRLPLEEFRINALICTDLQALGGSSGWKYEAAIMRTMEMSTDPVAVVGLSIPLADADDIANWISVDKYSRFNFSPLDRVETVTLEVNSYDIANERSQLMAMALDVVDYLANSQDTVVWVESRSQGLDVGRLLLSLSQTKELFKAPESSQPAEFEDRAVGSLFSNGIALIYNSIPESDYNRIMASQPRILLCTRTIDRPIQPRTTVIVMGTEQFDPTEGQRVAMTAAEVLKLTDRATTRALIMTTRLKHSYYEKFLKEPLPVESHLNFALADAILPGIAAGDVTSEEDVMNWLSESFFYRRLRKNPSYYGLTSTSDDSVDEFLSETVEEAVESLVAREVVDRNEDGDLVPRNEVYVAVNFGLDLRSVLVLRDGAHRVRLPDALETICRAGDWSAMSTNPKELPALQALNRSLRYPATERLFSTSDMSTLLQFKAHVLLRCHISRVAPPVYMRGDQTVVLLEALKTTKAFIDLLAGDGQLATLVAMDLHQMLTQALWLDESKLKQIPYVNDDAVAAAQSFNISSISDFIEIEDPEVRDSILGFTESDPRMLQVAQFVNNFPSIELSAHASRDDENDQLIVDVTVDRDVDEDSDLTVVAFRWPRTVTEQWYLLAGDAQSREVLAFKKVELRDEQMKFELQMALPDPAKQLTLWCICDSYIDADKEVPLSMAN